MFLCVVMIHVNDNAFRVNIIKRREGENMPTVKVERKLKEMK